MLSVQRLIAVLMCVFRELKNIGGISVNRSTGGNCNLCYTSNSEKPTLADSHQ